MSRYQGAWIGTSPGQPSDMPPASPQERLSLHTRIAAALAQEEPKTERVIRALERHRRMAAKAQAEIDAE